MSAENHMVYESASGLQPLDGLRWSAEQEARDLRRTREDLMDKLEAGDKKATCDFGCWLFGGDVTEEFARAAVDVEDGRTRQEVLDDWRQRWITQVIGDMGVADTRKHYGMGD